MEYQYLRERGALHEGAAVTRAGSLGLPQLVAPFDRVSLEIIELLPESVARENLIFPLAFDGETITIAAANPQDIALADKIRFMLAKNVRLVSASRQAIIDAINWYYNAVESESVDSVLCELNDSDVTAPSIDLESSQPRDRGGMAGSPRFRRGAL